MLENNNVIMYMTIFGAIIVVLFLFSVLKKLSKLLLVTLSIIIIGSVAMFVYLFSVLFIGNDDTNQVEKANSSQGIVEANIEEGVSSSANIELKDWEMIKDTANGNYASYNSLLVDIFNNDKEILKKIEAYNELMEIIQIVNEVNELRAAPVSYFLNYDGKLGEELLQKGKDYKGILERIEHVNIPNNDEYKLIYASLKNILTDLLAINKDGQSLVNDIKTKLMAVDGNIEKLNIEAVYSNFEKYQEQIKMQSKNLQLTKESLELQVKTITHQFEHDITEALKNK